MPDRPQYPSYPGDDSHPGDNGAAGSGWGIPQPQPQPGYNPPGYNPPPAYGQTPPPYGQVPPAYGQVPPPGYQPPPGYGQVPQPGYGLRPPVYAHWGVRVGASLLDGLIVFMVWLIPFIAGATIAFINAEFDERTDEITGGVNPLGVVIMILSFVIWLGFDIWNRGVRVGTRGQSLGKQTVGIRIVHADTGQFLGSGTGFLRWLMGGILGGTVCIGFVDLLWPLWDERRQTLHDKIVSSVAIRV